MSENRQTSDTRQRIHFHYLIWRIKWATRSRFQRGFVIAWCLLGIFQLVTLGKQIVDGDYLMALLYVALAAMCVFQVRLYWRGFYGR